jgi:hypothetical protein
MLASLTGDCYVEVDLVIPELMQDTDSWSKFPWYRSAKALPPGHGPVLIEVAEHSFALVFAPAPVLSQTPAPVLSQTLARP